MLNIFRLKRENYGTVMPVRHKNNKLKTLSRYTKKTLGSGNLRGAVVLPPGEDIREWMAANTVDFFNELNLLYSIIAETAPSVYSQPGQGFPPGFEYRWQRSKKLIRCTCWEYTDYVLTWVEEQLSNESIFPVEDGATFPQNFAGYIKDIFKRMFRVYAIIYTSFFELFKRFDAVRHLNTSFKHFMFFAFQFKLIGDREAKALNKLVHRLLEEFIAQSGN